MIEIGGPEGKKQNITASIPVETTKTPSFHSFIFLFFAYTRHSLCIRSAHSSFFPISSFAFYSLGFFLFFLEECSGAKALFFLAFNSFYKDEMAIDQNSIAKDLRPLNLNRNAADDSPLPEGFFPSPGYRHVYGGLGLGFDNTRSAIDAGASGLGFADAAWTPQSSSAGEEGSDEPPSRKVKFLCSFGGKILPRPSDGALRYVGGQTRIIGVRRDVGFQELVQKMGDACGQPVVIKYQLPEEDLDALVSVSCTEDLENMMEEYEKLTESSQDGTAKLRVFLFSASELDPSSGVQFSDLSDSGQRYVDAVNGIPEGVCILRRKESVASASSTQNSDGLMSGGDAVDSCAQVDSGGGDGASPVLLSPTGIVSSTGYDSGRLMYVPPTTATVVESLPLNLAPIITGHSQTYSSAGSEPETDRSVPATGQPSPPFNPPPSVVHFHPVPAYLQTYVNPHQGTFNRVDYTYNSSQLGYTSPHQLGLARPVHTHPDHPQQIPSHHQFVSMVHSPVTPSSSQLSVNPNTGQRQFVQVQQMPRVDPYLEETSFGTRVVQIPPDPSYKAFQSQLQPSGPLSCQTVEPYNWCQIAPVPPRDHLIPAEGWASQPHQGMPLLQPEKVLRTEDCYMCQKALPHAHSDTLPREHDNSGITKTISDTIAVLQTQHSDESMRSGLQQTLAAIGPEGTVEQQQNERALGVEANTLGFQGTGIPPRFAGHMDPTVHEVTAPQLVSYGFSQMPESLPDCPRTLIPLSVVGLQGDGQASYGMYVANLPQSPNEAVQEQPAAISQYNQVKKDLLTNKTVGTDIPPVRLVPFQNTEPSIPGQNADFLPMEDKGVGVSHDHIKPIDARIEARRISPSEVSIVSEKYISQIKPNISSPKDVVPENLLQGGQSAMQFTEPLALSSVNIAREDMPDNRPQIAGKEMHLTGSLIMPGIVPDGNYIKLIDPLPSSLEVGGLHYMRSEESSPVSQTIGNAGTYQNVRAGVEPPLPSEMWQGKPAFSYNDPIAPAGEWKHEALQFQSRRFFNDMAAPAKDNAPFSALNMGATNGIVGDNQDPLTSNSLFSSQDPWNLRHEMHFPLPKVPKVPSRELLDRRDSNGENRMGNCGQPGPTVPREEGRFHQPSEGLSKDMCSETAESVKGSAEEQIKQDLQAVAEGVAASVLLSSLPTVPVFTGQERNESTEAKKRNESTGEANQDREVYQNDIETQNTVAQDIKTKFMDKTNPSLGPIADGINRLQIIKNSDLEELRELGSGTFGTVYHGKWRGTDVAIKRINDRCFTGKASEQERMRDDFWNEACKLADLHHPNVVAFYGVVLDGPGGSVATVTEYMVNGSLRHALQRDDRTLDYRKRLLIAMDVAFGMEYLHGKNIVHFDLKSDNLLVNLRDPHRPICKVGDLGLSKVKCQTLISGGVRGTLPWMAPELLNGSSSLVSEKVDVFSFGIVMWELLTGEEPYADLHYGAIIGGIVSNTLRPPVPESCDPEWRSLMERCWSPEPSERPSFTGIADTLRSLASALRPKGQVHHKQALVQTQVQK